MKHSVAFCSASLFGLVLALAITSPVARAALVDWQVDTAQSYLRLTIPNQAVSIGGTPSGTAFLRTQAAPFGGWTSGNVARIGGTVSTHYSDFSSIEFLGGAQDLVGLNSGNYRPSPAVWDPQTNLFTNVSTTAAAAYGGQIGTTQWGALTVVVNPAALFSIRDVQYDLASANLPVAGGSFNASAAGFSMSSAEVALAGATSFGVPSQLASLQDAGFSIGGANGAAAGLILAPDPGQPNLRELRIPISVPIALDLFGGMASTLSGTATGFIVAYAVIPEPGGGGLVLLAGAFCGYARRRRLATD